MKIFARLFITLALWSLPALAQEDHGKNEVGLVIGGTVTPSQTLATGTSLIGSNGAVLSSRNLAFNPSLSLGAEYDRRFLTTRRFAIYGGVDFLASPMDVKLSQQFQNVIGQYAYIFLTPHVRVKFRPSRAFAPWLSFGGGYARFLEKAPPATPSFNPGTIREPLCLVAAWTPDRFSGRSA